jgi:PadR family transcriptional regulator, regulatory protein PadR
MTAKRSLKLLIMGAPPSVGKVQFRHFGIHILNRMIHIEDYYASVLGEFEQLVLLALLRLGNGAYGASIRREIRERTKRDVPIGSVYVTLARLERKEMVVSYVGLPSKERGGRRRKHYLMNEPGQRALGRSYRALKAMAVGIEGELEKI